MSKLRDLMMAMLESKNSEILDFLRLKTGAMESFVREKVVIPYCKKYGYSFDSGMGSYCFIDKEGNHFYPGDDCRYAKEDPKDGRPWKQDVDGWYLRPTEEDKELKEILGFQFAGTNCGIGAYMKDYINDGL